MKPINELIWQALKGLQGLHDATLSPFNHEWGFQTVNLPEANLTLYFVNGETTDALVHAIQRSLTRDSQFPCLVYVTDEDLIVILVDPMTEVRLVPEGILKAAKSVGY